MVGDGRHLAVVARSVDFLPFYDMFQDRPACRLTGYDLPNLSQLIQTFRLLCLLRIRFLLHWLTSPSEPFPNPYSHLTQSPHRARAPPIPEHLPAVRMVLTLYTLYLRLGAWFSASRSGCSLISAD